MASYIARIMDAETGGENTYHFEGPDDLLDQTPMRIVRTFFESIEKSMFPHEHLDYEINTAHKRKEHNVVLITGSYHLHSGDDLPFLMMIARAGDEPA